MIDTPTTHWYPTNGRHPVIAEPPKKKPSAQWQKGFDAGIAALLVTLQGVGTCRLIHSARVYMLADFDIDEAVLAAEQRFRAPTPKKRKRAKGDDDG